MQKLVLAFFSISILILSGCEKEDDNNNNGGGGCNLQNLTYVDDIQPLVTSNCAFSGCHVSPSPSAGLDLSNYAGLREATENGFVLNRIQRDEGQFGLMPPTGKMSNCNIDKILEWSMAGYPEN